MTPGFLPFRRGAVVFAYASRSRFGEELVVVNTTTLDFGWLGLFFSPGRGGI